MLDDFLIRAALAGAGIALIAGPLGCLVVWRRMAYFGDATAHAAILGVALALAFDVSIILGTVAVTLAMALTVSGLGSRGHSEDATLGVLAHGSLALGLVAISFVPGVTVDLQAYLFGDILAVSRGDLAVIWAGAALVLALIWWRWSRILTAILNPELAVSSGIDPRRESLVMTVTLALTVALSLKVVGALLVAAMLIIPAAAARSFARTPERMALVAALLGLLAVIAGLQGSLRFDSPAGPSIVSAATLIYVVAVMLGPVLARRAAR
ncbi:MAG: hypothetical protein HKN63_08330 [Rhodobacteraceae bacterium]|nr:hypothetical protein [Paracoccaceae bacterium]